jgi:NAD(P)H-dependent FMN reductase
MAPTKSIVIITRSTRTPRVGPHVAQFVKQTIQAQADLEGVEISAVDLATFKLPVYDEPAVPAMIAEPEKYTHEHSRRWAQEIARHDGYVLVSPEYNYGMPGGVKNAIDYVFHPWKGKPIAIVTYGLNGGMTSSEQLEHTLSRMGLRVCDSSISALSIDTLFIYSLLSHDPAFVMSREDHALEEPQ